MNKINRIMKLKQYQRSKLTKFEGSYVTQNRQEYQIKTRKRNWVTYKG